MPDCGEGFGREYGEGGLIYVADVSPDLDGTLGAGDSIDFVIGVDGDSIDLSKVNIIVNGEPAFVGALGGFYGQYAAASIHSASGPDNGYEFSIIRDVKFSTPNISIVIESADSSQTSRHCYSLKNGQMTSYVPTIFGRELGRVSLSKFTGEVTTGLLAGAAGQIFMTPAFSARSGSRIDVDELELTAESHEKYDVPSESNARPFVLGPSAGFTSRVFPPNFQFGYEPHTNSSQFRIAKTTRATVKGVLLNTSTLESVVILY